MSEFQFFIKNFLQQQSNSKTKVITHSSTIPIEYFNRIKLISKNALQAFATFLIHPTLYGKPYEIYTWKPNRFGDMYRFIDNNALQFLQESGGTIFVEDIHLFDDELSSGIKCVQIQDASVWSGAFFGYGKNGIAPHWDDNDFVVMQISGRKTWAFSNREHINTNNLNNRFIEHGGNQWEIDLLPGDLLYVPRKTIHSTMSYEGESLHIIIAKRWHHNNN